MPSREDDEPRLAGATARAAVAVELISSELNHADPNWRTIRILAARLVEIADRAARGIEPNGDGH